MTLQDARDALQRRAYHDVLQHCHGASAEAEDAWHVARMSYIACVALERMKEAAEHIANLKKYAEKLENDDLSVKDTTEFLAAHFAFTNGFFKPALELQTPAADSSYHNFRRLALKCQAAHRSGSEDMTPFNQLMEHPKARSFARHVQLIWLAAASSHEHGVPLISNPIFQSLSNDASVTFNRACVALTRGQDKLAVDLLESISLEALLSDAVLSAEDLRLQLIAAKNLATTEEVKIMHRQLVDSADPLLRFVLRSNILAATADTSNCRWVPIGAVSPSLSCERHRRPCQNVAQGSAGALVCKSQMPRIMWNTAAGLLASKNGKAALEDYLKKQEDTWFPSSERLQYIYGSNKISMQRNPSVRNSLILLTDDCSPRRAARIIRRLPEAALSLLPSSSDHALFLAAVCAVDSALAVRMCSYTAGDLLATQEQLRAAADLMVDTAHFALARKLIARVTDRRYVALVNATCDPELLEGLIATDGEFERVFATADADSLDTDALSLTAVPLYRADLRRVPPEFMREGLTLSQGVRRPRKRRGFPGGLDPAKDGHPDLERWIPLKQRSTYVPKKGERISRNAQGVASAAAAEAVGKPAATASTAAIKLTTTKGGSSRGGSSRGRRRGGRR